MVISPTTLQSLTWAMLVVSLAGTTIAMWILISVRRRRDFIERSAPGDLVATLTVRRSVRQEGCYLVCQLAILAVTLYSLYGLLGSATSEEAPHFVSSYAARAVVVLALTYSSIRDLRDRGQLAQEIDRRRLLGVDR